VVWPSDERERRAGVGQLILSSPNGALTDYYQVDLASGAVKALARPSDHATLVAYRPGAGDLTLFNAEERTGTVLTIARGAERRALIETNDFLRGVAEGELKMISYRGLDGDDLKAWMILPPGYESGKRYPMVTWVYAGSVVRDAPSILTRINFSHGLNLQLMAARGYVVMLPSMPLQPEPDGKRRLGSDPFMELTKGVLPAVDKAIDLGIADPKRLAVFGQSYGGYSTYGLVTQTNRFQAAIALAGLSDLVSLYGIFDARDRYEPFPHEDRFRQSIAETGQTRMGNPPWKDWGRFLRNSPLFYVDRVQTPLLIIQGDMDYVAMQQGEEFFTGLYRQGKRARFVRYWGEGHVFNSPANIKDMWAQMDRWLNECFAPPPAAGDKLTQKP
jgi:dipeptidyl aminopeptidase/acylaminoacyl peptidase